MKEIDLVGNQFGDIRTFQHETELYFVGIDVAKALGYENPRDALAKHCDFEFDASMASRSGGVILNIKSESLRD